MPKYDNKVTYTIGECLLTYKIHSFYINVSKAPSWPHRRIIYHPVADSCMRQVGKDHMGIPPIIANNANSLMMITIIRTRRFVLSSPACISGEKEQRVHSIVRHSKLRQLSRASCNHVCASLVSKPK